MSIMDDANEIDAWDAYTVAGDMHPTHIAPRSHRAPEVPSAFPFKRILLGLTVLTMAAVFINSETVSRQPQPERALPATISIVEPQTIPGVELATPRVDTGSEVDSDPRDTGRSSRSADERKPITPPVSRVETAIAYALAQVGDRYSWGAAGPNAFDCSGLVLMAFKQIGITLPHYTGTMIGFGTKVSKSAMQRGDIVFPSSGHVAIYLGNGQMVAASSGKGHVVVQPVYGFYAARRLV